MTNGQRLGLGRHGDRDEQRREPVPAATAATRAPSPDSAKIDSYWPHHALTYGTAGTNSTAIAPMTAQRGRSRKATTMTAASPRSASDAGTFMSERIHGSEASVTVAKAGSTAASTAQM